MITMPELDVILVRPVAAPPLAVDRGAGPKRFFSARTGRLLIDMLLSLTWRIDRRHSLASGLCGAMGTVTL